jgi:tetratricopeptide (TPR) repeat protein
VSRSDIFNAMTRSMPSDPAREIASAVESYRETNDLSALLERLLAVAAVADVETLIAAVEPYRTIPEIAGPIYERVVADRPDDARALVALANAYWLSGRGADATGALASRAIAADPQHRGAWHLWALTEADPRARMLRWKQVTERFPDDELARATLADAAAGIAGAERDREALQLAIRSYDALLKTAEHPDQRAALEQALTTLRGWSL